MLGSKLSAASLWLFNIVGAVDLLNAYYQGNRISLVPGQLGMAYVIPTLVVPLLLVTHALVFRILLRAQPAVLHQGLRSAA